MKNKRNNESGLEVSVGVIIQLAHYFRILKLDVEALFKAVGLDMRVLELPDERVPLEKYIRLETAAANASGDPCFGLHMGQYMEAGNWSILGYMMMNCKTLAEAFEKSFKYSAIIGNVITADIALNRQTIKITLQAPKGAPAISRHCYEGFLSSLICLARSLSGQPINALEVGLASAKPEFIDAYQAAFGSPVLFDQQSNYMIMAVSVGDIPVLRPNESLLAYFETYAADFLAGITEKTKTYMVKKWLLANMDSEHLTIELAAKVFAVSVRSLQDQLKKEGTEFRQLLQQTREQLAKKYLQDQYTVEDITYLLGFSDHSTFRKAFKKWTGLTPKEYRTIQG